MVADRLLGLRPANDTKQTDKGGNHFSNGCHQICRFRLVHETFGHQGEPELGSTRIFSTVVANTSDIALWRFESPKLLEKYGRVTPKFAFNNEKGTLLRPFDRLAHSDEDSR